MANNWKSKELLPDPASLKLRSVERGEQGWVVEASCSGSAACPDCGVLSRARHSSYLRHLKDLPIQGVAVKMKLRVGRWRCRNAACERRIFCQRLASVTRKRAQETNRFLEVVQLIGYALGGRPGEQLIARLGLPVSDDTLLRRIKQMAKSRPPSGPIPVVGVDDWAWRKSSRYGTILIDLQQREVADLLPERSADAFAQWLQEHPEVTTISRDRHGLYAEGARRGAPQAQQVADRFHLVQNLIEAMEGELAQQRHHLLMPAAEFVEPSDTAVEAPIQTPPAVVQLPGARQREQVRQQRRQQQLELFGMVKGLYAQGRKASQIVRETGIGRRRVDQWLQWEELPERNRMEPRPGMAESMRETARRLWDQGWRNGKRLFVEMRKLGYVGSYAGIRRLLEPWREERRAAKRAKVTALLSTAGVQIGVPVRRQVSPQVAAALLSQPKRLLRAEQCKTVEFLKQASPSFAAMRRLVLSFRGILCHGKASSLQRWVDEAEASGIEVMRRFVRKLKQDWAAVKNAVEQTWSNGPAEGHINRLKTLKRQMYGRARFELLRARMLPFTRRKTAT
jgi:transposase